MSTDSRLDDETGRLGALARVIEGTKTPSRFEGIARLAREALDAPLAAVNLIERERQTVCIADGLPLGDGPREAAFCSRTILGREAFIVNDALADPRFRDNPYVVGEPGIRAYIGAPLATADGYNFGALCVIDLRPRRFGAAEASLLQHLAGVVAAQIMRGLDAQDPLTGVLGFQAWRDRSAQMMTELRAEGRSGALLLAEADGLAAANRYAGAEAGDELLRLLAEALSSVVGHDAAIGRVAGDQFAAVLPGCDAEAALSASQTALARFKDAPRTLLRAGEGGMDVGAAALVGSIDTPETWLSVAELSLSFAKDMAATRLKAG